MESAPTGSEFASSIADLELQEREGAIWEQLVQGNIPSFLRESVPLHIQRKLQEKSYDIILYVMPDYLSIGTNDDHLLMPMSPLLAQRVADFYDAVLPTREVVDLIWKNAELKLVPTPIPPSPAMVTIGVFQEHDKMINEQRLAVLTQYPWGTLTAGHKKDVILSSRMIEKSNKVFIYGWHYPNGDPIQPVYGGHAIWYADYSHGIRLISSHGLLNGELIEISTIYQDKTLYKLLSDESTPMEIVFYDTSSSNYLK